MQYHQVQTDDNGNTYSIDMIRIKFQESKKTLQEIMTELLEERLNDTYRKVLYSQSFKDGTYQHFFSIEYFDHGTVKMGFCFLGATREQYQSGFIEFNPNKLAKSDEFWEFYKRLMRKASSASLSRFDLAIDMPISRDKVLMMKDNRKYMCIMASSFDKTEYLGLRNHVGRVKLYNKQLEQNLDYPLTRLEITCDGENISIPYIADLRQLPKGDDGALVKALYSHPFATEVITLLTPYQRKKVCDAFHKCSIPFDDHCIEHMTAFAVSMASGIKTRQINHTNRKEQAYERYIKKAL